MGRDVIYRVGFYSGGRHYFTGRPFLFDTLGVIRYSEPDEDNLIDLDFHKINHGAESDVKKGESYTLHYLNREGKWINHSAKQCTRDGYLKYKNVPSGAFYFLFSSSDTRHLARIFLIGEDGEQKWY